MTDIIVRFLSNLVDQFKMKNPIVFAIIAVVLLTVYYTAGIVIDYETAPGTPLVTDSIRNILESIQNVLVVVLAIIGAHTPESFSLKKSTYKKIVE